MSKKPQRGLGRGLSALMADVAPEDNSEPERQSPSRGVTLVAIEKLAANPDQPRRRFAKAELEELAASIRAHGVIQPLIVRENPTKSNSYQIVAGERRWRAAQLAKLHEMPVVVRNFDDDEVLQVAIIENIQRQDLNPVEEGRGYRQLIDAHGHTQEALADALGKSRSHIANTMRLLTLPAMVLDFVEEGRLSAGHARALVTAENPTALAQMVVKQGLSVRETERLAKKRASPGGMPAKGKPKTKKDADTRALEGDLSANLGMSVRIEHEPGGEAGRLSVTYRTLDQLDELCRILSKSH